MEYSKNRLIKVALYGDSLACPRIGVVKTNERYIAHLENHLRKVHQPDYIELRDKSRGGATIKDLFSEYKEDNTYYELPGDIFILHSGVVDCAPRPLNEKVKSRIQNVPNWLRKMIVKFVHNNRANLIKLNKGGYVKTSAVEFEKTLTAFLQHATNNYKKVFVINICPTNARIEQHSPGFTNNILVYNGIVKDVVNSIKSENLYLIDIFSAAISNIDHYILKEDGHHIYPVTHRFIADEIIKILN